MTQFKNPTVIDEQIVMRGEGGDPCLQEQLRLLYEQQRQASATERPQPIEFINRPRVPSKRRTL